MCRLFGLRARGPVDPSALLSRLRPFGSEHAHGWGLAWYDREEVYLHKETCAAIASETFADLAAGLRPTLLVCHLRRATQGEVTPPNTHPFRRGAWTFAHNGNVDRAHVLALGDLRREELEGQTDSEAFFLWLRRCIEREGGDVPAGVARAVAPLAPEHYHAVNFLLSDGETLYAYRDASIRHDAYSLYAAPLVDSAGTEMVAVSSERLTDDAQAWSMLGLGELLVIAPDGCIRSERIR